MNSLLREALKSNPSTKPIKYDELHDCKMIMNSCDNLTPVDMGVIDSITELEKQARFQPSSDFTYELLELLKGKNSDAVEKVMEKYFPRPKYDPARE